MKSKCFFNSTFLVPQFFSFQWKKTFKFFVIIIQIICFLALYQIRNSYLVFFRGQIRQDWVSYNKQVKNLFPNHSRYSLLVDLFGQQLVAFTRRTIKTFSTRPIQLFLLSHVEACQPYVLYTYLTLGSIKLK
jgi:hypothetical protein